MGDSRAQFGVNWQALRGRISRDLDEAARSCKEDRKYAGEIGHFKRLQIVSMLFPSADGDVGTFSEF